MFDQRIEKPLILLVLLSLLLHAGIGVVIYLQPPAAEKEKTEQVTMVDLAELPVLPPPPEPQQEPPPMPLRTKMAPRVHREAAPHKDQRPERVVETKSAPNVKTKPEPTQQQARSLGSTESTFRSAEKGGKEAVRGEGIFRPQSGEKVELGKLFPNAKSISRMEDNLRKKYEKAEQGDTRLMDTDDPTITVFSRRYARALRDRLNALDTPSLGIGRTILILTFERDGSVSDVKILESTGNSVLDDFTTRSSRSAGFVGPLPRSWQHEQLKLIFGFSSSVSGSVSARWFLTDSDR